MYTNISIAVLCLTALGILCGINVLIGKVHGVGNIAIGIVCSSAALYILINPKDTYDLSSGFNEVEKLSFDAKFDDLKINGHVVGTIKTE